MDQILKNTYNNIPVCISDALKELYIMQKKLQEECKIVSTQSKNLVGFYEKDMNILKNEIQEGQVSFNLYCQNTTDKIENLKNKLQNEVYINNIKNEEWRQQTESKLFQDTIYWKDGANNLKVIIDKAQSISQEFSDYKERINKQKLEISQFKEYLLENCKNNTEIIKELNKQLNINDMSQESSKLKKELQDLQAKDSQKIKDIQKIEVTVNNQVAKSLTQIQEVAQNLKQYIKDNDNYVSNNFKLAFDVNQDQRKISDDIEEIKKFIQFHPIEEVQNEQNDSNISQQMSYIDRIKQIKQNQEMIKTLEEKISEIFNQISSIQEKNYNENPKNQIDFLRLQLEQQQIIFFEQIKNDIKQTLQQHSQNIQDTYFIPLMNKKSQTLLRPQNQIDDERYDSKNIKINKSDRNCETEQINSMNTQQNNNQQRQPQKRNKLFRSIKSLDPYKDVGVDDQNKQIFIKNNLQNVTNVQNLGQGDSRLLTALTIEPCFDGSKMNKKINSKNNSHANSRKEIIHEDVTDFNDIYKQNNISPDISPLKAKYQSNQQFQSKGVQSKNDLNKQNRTVSSFKKRLTDDQNSSQNLQEAQDTNQYNITFQTEEDNMINQISQNNNQNHLNFSKLKSLMSTLAVKNTNTNNSGVKENSILNNTLPDLSFNYATQTPEKKQVDSLANYRMMQNKNLISTCYTVMSNQKQNKMSVLNLSLDHINPQKSSQQLHQSTQQPQCASFSSQLLNSSQITAFSLNQQGNKSSMIRAQKYQLMNNNQNTHQRATSQQGHRNSISEIMINNKSAQKIQTRPKTTQDNIEINYQKK